MLLDAEGNYILSQDGVRLNEVLGIDAGGVHHSTLKGEDYVIDIQPAFEELVQARRGRKAETSVEVDQQSFFDPIASLFSDSVSFFALGDADKQEDGAGSDEEKKKKR